MRGPEEADRRNGREIESKRAKETERWNREDLEEKRR